MKCWVLPLILAGTAEAQSARDWLIDNVAPGRVTEAGAWSASSGIVFAVDPLTLYGRDHPIEGLPTTPAQVLGLRPDEDPGSVGLLALIWSDAPVVCGAGVATIGVDAGLASFVSPVDLVALDAFAAAHKQDLYAGTYAAQIDDFYPGPMLIDLPNATAFPVSGSDWGDGGYPVATLRDASGNVTALYTQFITAEGEDWLLPAPCSDSSS